MHISDPFAARNRMLKRNQRAKPILKSEAMKVLGYLATVASAAMGLTFATPASAAYVVTFEEVGSNVVTTGSGSLNVTALTRMSERFADRALLRPNPTLVIVGPAASTFDNLYNGLTGPSALGPGTGTRVATIGSGPIFGVSALSGNLVVPDNYVSGTDLGISTTTYNNITIAGMGLTPGRYVYTWGSGSTADTFTVIVPEPASIAFAGVAAVGLLARRRRS